ncbi:MAG: PAS domain-containing protein, partial [Oxalobacteraceae bacterium]
MPDNRNIDSRGNLDHTEAQGFDSDHSDIFYAAIQRSRMPMILTDPNRPDNPIVFFNTAFSTLIGYPPEEILNRNCRFLQGEETDRDKVAYVGQQILAEKDCSVELLNYRKDGTSFWNALFISPVYDNDGKLAYYFASQLDVTRRVKSEELLRQTQKIETLGQLTGGIAHDFNNMLTVVMGNLNMAQNAMEVKQPDRVSVYLDRAMAAAKSSDRLTQQLLSFARKQRMTTERLDLNEVVRQVQTMFERVLTTGIYVSAELTSDPWMVSLDPSHAQSAFLNVLLNARDAIPATGGSIKLRTRNRIVDDKNPFYDLAEGAYVELSIEDTGSGMSEETKMRVFEPFFTTKGVGTTISFIFPTDDAHAVERDRYSGSRILVVEDNQMLRE